MEREQLIGPGSYHTALFLFPQQSGGQNSAAKTHRFKKKHGIPIDIITTKNTNTEKDRNENTNKSTNQIKLFKANGKCMFI